MRILHLFLAMTLAAFGPAAIRAQPEAFQLAADLEVEPLAESIWLYRATAPVNGRPIESNGLVIETAEGAFVIDTPVLRHLAQE